MGNSICRLILPPDSGEDVVVALAGALRGRVTRPVTLYLRHLANRARRNTHLAAARNAGLSIVDIWPDQPALVLAEAATEAVGDGAFVVRVADDEGEDELLPDADALGRLYPKTALDWVLEPEDKPAPWDVAAFYVCPGNPAEWPLTIPLMARLLHVAKPGDERPCPICATTYTSQGDRGQCPSCGFVAQPFKTVANAKRMERTKLDAAGWGKCPRCRRAHKFAHQVEQCFRCGQLMTADAGRYRGSLKDNVPEVLSLVRDLQL